MNHVKYRVGKWLPSDRSFLNSWIEKKVNQVKHSNLPLSPAISDLRDAIYNDPILFMGFTSMYDQIPQGYNEPVKNFETMLLIMNQILQEAPCYSNIENTIGLVGFPINAILDWAMGTQGGYLTFTNTLVNEKLNAILNEWKLFLQSSDSQYVLTDGPIFQPQPDYTNPIGWFSPDALEAIAAMDPLRGQGNDPQDALANFIYNYQCDPNAPYFGYKSWDDFFTREFNPGVREVSDADKDPSVIVNACESAPYNCVTNAMSRDKFWMKGQPYSLLDIMDNHPLAEQFGDNSTVYQAFLCAKTYHRWNSPVDGKIVAVQNVLGTYYAEAPVEGYDPAGPNDSQGYITEIAARALIFIQSDNEKIGLMCFVAVGMAEVSSCEITVNVGDQVKKGDPIGTFHFGGSTHCLIFRPGINIDFDFHGQTPCLNTYNIPVKARIGVITN
ncbi:phosphatidylserine decarboxylase family protein [Chryseobacterium potabilaquae]|uniref:Phosphatidylserine decarboxylase proenzyme n=1 Tax=Chryseobacterium potabilaquae TaxID=2675057 RepID=A0A6N4XC44_9FLAO|nr:phosphatidylserine decarboxylase family protein [Chryseobacterium potabilaquae]CAA7196066.1 Phosphatidylserine decarboxylase proenzyme [Chryseobacterium potabilaquae]